MRNNENTTLGGVVLILRVSTIRFTKQVNGSESLKGIYGIASARF